MIFLVHVVAIVYRYWGQGRLGDMIDVLLIYRYDRSVAIVAQVSRSKILLWMSFASLLLQCSLDTFSRHC